MIIDILKNIQYLQEHNLEYDAVEAYSACSEQIKLALALIKYGDVEVGVTALSNIFLSMYSSGYQKALENKMAPWVVGETNE